VFYLVFIKEFNAFLKIEKTPKGFELKMRDFGKKQKD
jgi:hypothetical protein